MDKLSLTWVCVLFKIIFFYPKTCRSQHTASINKGLALSVDTLARPVFGFCRSATFSNVKVFKNHRKTLQAAKKQGGKTSTDLCTLSTPSRRHISLAAVRPHTDPCHCFFVCRKTSSVHYRWHETQFSPTDHCRKESSSWYSTQDD